MNKILYFLCRHCVSIMDGWYPYPARLIAKQSGISIYKTRKELKKLKENGFVRTFSVYIENDEETFFPYNGWGITQKAKETKEYKTAREEEDKLVHDVFGIQ